MNPAESPLALPSTVALLLGTCLPMHWRRTVPLVNAMCLAFGLLGTVAIAHLVWGARGHGQLNHAVSLAVVALQALLCAGISIATFAQARKSPRPVSRLRAANPPTSRLVWAVVGCATAATSVLLMLRTLEAWHSGVAERFTRTSSVVCSVVARPDCYYTALGASLVGCVLFALSAAWCLSVVARSDA